MLGDSGPELVEGNYRAAHDEELAAHLNAVAEVFYLIPRNRVLVHLIVIDTPEAESFTVAPVQIYIPRKMVALLRNDDKLARLLGHELFREILGC
jgi:predicted Zn-dependent protease